MRWVVSPLASNLGAPNRRNRYGDSVCRLRAATKDLYDDGRYANPFSFVKHWRAIPVGLILFAESARQNAALAREGISTNQHGDYVVLVHGLGRTAWSMKRLEWTLTREGYRVINLSYPSIRLSIQDAPDDWLAALLQEHAPHRTAKIHFVTHSLGA